MKNTSKFIALIIAIMLSSSTFAYQLIIDGIYYNKQPHSGRICNATLSVTYRDFDYNTYSGDVVIPDITSYKDVNYEVDAIDIRAFMDCKDLTSVSLPNTIKMIHYQAFANCTALKSITIPSSVNYIGDKSFEGCTNIDTIYIDRKEPPIVESETFAGLNEHFVICVPCGSREAYAQAEGFENVIIVDCDGVGIKGIDTKTFSIYPNPATDKITLDLGDLTLDANNEVSIINNLGQIVYQTNLQSQISNISLKDFESGVYFIQIGNLRRKLIVK